MKFLSYDILKLISEFASEYVMDEWFYNNIFKNCCQLNYSWSYLSKNPFAIYFLIANKEKIDWSSLCQNPADLAIDLLIKNKEKIDYSKICSNTNPRVLPLIEEQFLLNINLIKNNNIINKNINKFLLSKNPIAIPLLKKYSCLIDEMGLCSNPNAYDLIKSLLKYKPHRVNWYSLSANPCAIKLLQTFPVNIKWDFLNTNPHPEALQILVENKDKININFLCDNLNKDILNLFEFCDLKYIHWSGFSRNPSFIDILKSYPEKIDWMTLCKNPNCFSIVKDYFINCNCNYLYFTGKKLGRISDLLSNCSGIFRNNSEDIYNILLNIF